MKKSTFISLIMIAIILFMVVPRVAYAFDIREIPFKNDLTLSDLILIVVLIFEGSIKAFPKLKKYSFLLMVYKIISSMKSERLTKARKRINEK